VAKRRPTSKKDGHLTATWGRQLREPARRWRNPGYIRPEPCFGVCGPTADAVGATRIPTTFKQPSLFDAIDARSSPSIASLLYFWHIR
jgi:hypothetical protein